MEVWYLHPSPLPGSGWALTKRPSLPCHPGGARLENRDLNPEFADVRSCPQHLLRRLCHQQPGACAAFCFLTDFMNFNGQLLPGFSFSSRCFPPAPAALRVTLLLPRASPGSRPALGILRAPQKPSPASPPAAMEVSPQRHNRQHGAFVAVLPAQWCRGSGRWLWAPRWLFPKFNGCKGSRDATSETSVFISSCLTPPRGTITKGSNLITVTQQSAGEHVSPGCLATAIPTTGAAASPRLRCPQVLPPGDSVPPGSSRLCDKGPPGVFWASDDVSPGPM